MPQCPLCNQDARVTETDNLLKEVSCDRCGRYYIERQLFDDGLGDVIGKDKVHILSAITRRFSDAENFVSITESNITELLQSARIPTSVIDKSNETLLYVSERQNKPNDYVEVFFNIDYPLTFSSDKDEFRHYLDTLADKGFLERLGHTGGPRANQRFRLTFEGWEKVEQLKKVQIDSDQAFVAMSFSEHLKPVWEYGFKLALKDVGYKAIRADEVQHNDKIIDRIIADIRQSGLLVADLTEQSNGVYFEVGFAMGLGINVIWTCKKSDMANLHFDTQQYNHIPWESAEELREQLQNRIAATIPGRTLPATT